MEENNANSGSDNKAEANTETESTDSANSSKAPLSVESASPATFGDWLKHQRTSRKVSLEEIAAVTKVHIMQLKALEENEVARLPAPAFVRGFLVSYARHLGLDQDDVLDRYKTSFGGSLTPIADLLMPATNRASRSASAPKVAMVSSPQMREAPSTRNVEGAHPPRFSMRNIALTVGIVGILALVGSLMSIGKKSKLPDPSAPTTLTESTTTPVTPPLASSTETPAASATLPPPLPPAEKEATPPVAPSEPVKATEKVPEKVPEKVAEKAPETPPVSTVPDSPKKFQLEIKALEGNYVHLRVDDVAPKGITLKAGQAHVAGVDKRAVLTISDAGNVEIRWNGTWYAAPGFRGDLKVITLPDQLSQLTAKGAAAPKAPRPKAKAVEGAAPAPTTPDAE